MEDPLLSNIKLLIRGWRMDAARRRSLATKQTMKMKFRGEAQEMPTPEGKQNLEMADLIEQLTAELEHVIGGGELP